jgi:hypothetical protein
MPVSSGGGVLVVFLVKAGAAARNDMPRIVAQKCGASQQINALTVKKHLAKTVKKSTYLAGAV